MWDTCIMKSRQVVASGLAVCLGLLIALPNTATGAVSFKL